MISFLLVFSRKIGMVIAAINTIKSKVADCKEKSVYLYMTTTGSTEFFDKGGNLEKKIKGTYSNLPGNEDIGPKAQGASGIEPGVFIDINEIKMSVEFIGHIYRYEVKWSQFIKLIECKEGIGILSCRL